MDVIYIVDLYEGQRHSRLAAADRFAVVRLLETLGGFDATGRASIRNFLEAPAGTFVSCFASTDRYDAFGVATPISMVR